MTDEPNPSSSDELALQRLHHLLERLTRQGVQQHVVAAQAGLPPQYLSDIKNGRRPLTELVARRIGQKYSVNYEWLIGRSDSMEPSAISAAPMSTASGGVWLPVFPHPVEGEPRTLPIWDGAGMEITGAAASKLVLTKWPYILRFGSVDGRGRVQKGDLILISQSFTDHAEIYVVRCGRELFLARQNPDESWERLATGKKLGTCRVAGYCVGIIWSDLSSSIR